MMFAYMSYTHTHSLSRTITVTNAPTAAGIGILRFHNAQEGSDWGMDDILRNSQPTHTGICCTV